jgi:hypothetical protein
MSTWELAQTDPSERLSKLHFFSAVIKQPCGDVEFRITVREFATEPRRGMRFYATTDKQTNQSTAPFTPVGWGSSLEDALSRCMHEIHRFPYEPVDE